MTRELAAPTTLRSRSSSTSVSPLAHSIQRSHVISVYSTRPLGWRRKQALGLVRKHAFMHHELDVVRLVTELGDALWCLTAAAGALGVSLDEIAAVNLTKLSRRYPEGYSDEASNARKDT